MEMDGLVEDEGSMYVMEESQPAFGILDYISYMLDSLAQYGWYILFGGFAAVYVARRVRLASWLRADPDAEYKKDPDKALARMEALQRARQLQQRRLEDASRRAADQQKEREERKRAEALERLQKYGTAAGQKLGTVDDDYLPLSGGASASSYRPPKRSKCGGGGCGR